MDFIRPGFAWERRRIIFMKKGFRWVAVKMGGQGALLSAGESRRFFLLMKARWWIPPERATPL